MWTAFSGRGASMCALLVVIATATANAGMLGKESVVLTPSNFKETVLDSDLPWVVAFYAPWCGHCKSLVGAWAKAATATKGMIQFGQVDADAHKSLAGQFGVKGFPTIKLFGADKKAPQDHNGARDAEGLVQGALALANSVISARLGGGSGGGGSGGSGGSAVVDLTDASFESKVLKSKEIWAVAFVAPWCGYCKKLEPEWASASTSLKGKASLGKVDATASQALGAKYKIESYPTIKLFINGEMSDYEGGRTASDIVTYMEEKALAAGPAPEVVQMNSSAVFDSSCKTKQLCFIAFLPSLEESGKSGRNAYIDVLKASAEKYKRRPFGWVWSEAAAQPAAEKSLEVGGFGFPALVALNVKKAKFGTMRGQFSADGVSEFVNKLVAGRQPTVTMTGELTIADAPTWDGGEFVQVAVEEEFDLSDLDDVELDAKDKTEL